MLWIKSSTLYHYSLDFVSPKFQNLRDKNTDKVKEKWKKEQTMQKENDTEVLV